MDQASWGPGRVDTFNPPKALLGFPMEKAPDREKMGNADFPAVWNQKWKEGMQLHWDGNNTAVDERNLSAGFGTGATPTTIDKEGVLRMAGVPVGPGRAAGLPRGARRQRARGPGRARLPAGLLVAVTATDTRPSTRTGTGAAWARSRRSSTSARTGARLDSYTEELAAAQNSLYAGFPAAEDEDFCREHPDDTDRCYPARFSHFRKTFGYANMPLDGLWLRAPYLHNGSVPDLASLLEPSELPPGRLLDRLRRLRLGTVGFVTQGPTRSVSGGASTRRCAATATAVTCRARSSHPPRRPRCSST